MMYPSMVIEPIANPERLVDYEAEAIRSCIVITTGKLYLAKVMGKIWACTA